MSVPTEPQDGAQRQDLFLYHILQEQSDSTPIKSFNQLLCQSRANSKRPDGCFINIGLDTWLMPYVAALFKPAQNGSNA